MRVYRRKEEHMKWAFVEVLLGKDDLCSVVWFYEIYARRRTFMIVPEDLCSLIDRSRQLRSFAASTPILLHRKKLTSRENASLYIEIIF